MQTVIVLFNLKAGVEREAYERWARESDLPVVNALPSMERFEVLRASGLLIGDGPSPYDYVEIMRVPDLAALGRDLAAPEVQAGAARFQEFADNPVFILTSAL